MGKQSDPVFKQDELQLVEVDPSWTAEDILGREGVFFLKDIAKPLKLEPVKVKHHAREILRRGSSPWEVMGARKIWNHWVLRMKLFAPYYRKHLISRVCEVQPEWDGNQLLEQSGTFYLTDVCRKIPFTSHQLRYQSKRERKSRQTIGIWKDPELKSYLIDMEVFSPWIKRIWLGEPGNEKTFPLKRAAGS